MPELLLQPAALFRGSRCSYCLHIRADHPNDGECAECILHGNVLWPPCPRFTRTAKTPEEVGRA